MHKFRSIAFFPWTSQSYASLKDKCDSGGMLKNDLSQTQWNDSVAAFSDAAVVASDRQVHIFHLAKNKEPLSITFPEVCIPLNCLSLLNM